MHLPEADEDYLNSKGLNWSLIPDGEGGFLIITDYRVNQGKYGRASVNLMIKIPPQYNNAKLDMYYVEPELRIKETGQYPNAADVFEEHVNKRWQRFSRHLDSWRAGVDGLPMFLALVNQELH